MAKPVMQNVLILCKTNPTPSSSYVETVCIAGMKPDGSLIRLYPVPFRLMDEKNQFKKWQYIDILIEKNPKDHRPESHKVYIENLKIGEEVDTKAEWKVRRQLLDKIQCYISMDEIKKLSEAKKISLALLKPKEIIKFEIKPCSETEWTKSQRESLEQIHQIDMFNPHSSNDLKMLRKIPYDFYIYFTDESSKIIKHKIIDWEIGALYWHTYQSNDWQQKMQDKLNNIFSEREVYFLMGNEHRFQHNWHIISLIYPPKQLSENFSFAF